MPDQMTDELTTIADRIRRLAAGTAVDFARVDLEAAADRIDSAIGCMNAPSEKP